MTLDLAGLGSEEATSFFLLDCEPGLWPRKPMAVFQEETFHSGLGFREPCQPIGKEEVAHRAPLRLMLMDPR